jgi:hypothetical protein
MIKKISGVLLETQMRISGSYPDVPLASGINLETMIEGDSTPVFVTLPIGKVDTESRNGRKYDRKAVTSLVETINSETAIGQKGHLRDDERAYRFDVPPLTWVGATLESDGTAWGKAYVSQSAADVREYVKIAKATNAKIGTSIYGTADVDDDGNVSNLQIESIDLAHPGRLGVPMAGAVPKVTQETLEEDDIEESTEMPSKQEQAPEATPAQIIELRREHTIAFREIEGRVAELEGQVADLNTVLELLGENGKPATDAIAGVRVLQTNLQNLRQENQDLLGEAIESQVTKLVKVENVRAIIVDMVTATKPATRQAVADAVQDVLSREAVKVLLKDSVKETMGPNQTRPNQKDDEDEPGTSSPINIPQIPAKEAS